MKSLKHTSRAADAPSLAQAEARPDAVDPEDRDRLIAAAARLREEVGRRIVGQERVLDEILMALIAGGHALLVGVPGLAKTLMVRSRRRGDAPRLPAHPVHAGPGAERHHGHRDPRGGLARPARAASASCAARSSPTSSSPTRSTARRRARRPRCSRRCRSTASPRPADDALPEPFFVLATQNPIEQEGTYPLPEAQLDRFLFDIRVGYPRRTRRSRSCAARRRTRKPSSRRC